MKLCTLSQARFERQKTQFSEFQNKILFNSRNLYLFDASNNIWDEKRTFSRTVLRSHCTQKKKTLCEANMNNVFFWSRNKNVKENKFVFPKFLTFAMIRKRIYVKK
jgi:hypothetical protein